MLAVLQTKRQRKPKRSLTLRPFALSLKEQKTKSRQILKSLADLCPHSRGSSDTFFRTVPLCRGSFLFLSRPSPFVFLSVISSNFRTSSPLCWQADYTTFFLVCKYHRVPKFWGYHPPEICIACTKKWPFSFPKGENDRVRVTNVNYLWKNFFDSYWQRLTDMVF